MAHGSKDKVIDISDMSGGKNNARLHNAIADNEVFDCYNAILDQRGYRRAPGLLGIDTEPALPTYCRMLDFYKKSTGAESLYAVSNSKLNLVAVAGGALTEKYSLAAGTEAYGENFKGKYFLNCGDELIKIESNDTAYKVGIAAPTGASAIAAGSSGTLDAGDYIVYVSYARKVSGVVVLYSYPQTVGTVTISGTQGIQVTCANSADPQVSCKVVWIIEPSGTTAYYYYLNDDNTTTVFTINDASQKNIFLNMAVEAVSNYPIPAFDSINFFDGRMLGWKGQKLYWSIKSGTVYDLERFPQENYREFGHDIISCFEVNETLYVNTVGGLYKILDGDVASKAPKIAGSLHFVSQRLHEVYKGVCWGVTNDGVRYFDGTNWSMDLSKNIKQDIDRLISGMATNYYPCLKIYSRIGKRTELQISYRDTLKSSINNTTRLILNLDSLYLESELVYKTAWETFSGGCNYMAVSNDGTLYMAQNRSGAGAQILKEVTNDVADKYVYSETGAYLTALTDKECYVVTKAFVIDIIGITIFDSLHLLALLNGTLSVSFSIFDRDVKYTDTVSKKNANPILFSKPILFPVVLPGIIPVCDKIKLPGGNMKGKMIYLKISQLANDPTFTMHEIKIHGTLEVSSQS
jgi:hypothetical protein